MLKTLRGLLGLETKSSIATSDAELLEWFGAAPSAAGIRVSPREALRCAPVRAAVAAISEPIGTLPVHVFKRTADGKVRATDHPIYRLLHDQANDFTPASLFREQLTADALLHKGGFAYIARNSESQPVSLHRLNPFEYPVTVKHDPFAGPSYEMQQGGNGWPIRPPDERYAEFARLRSEAQMKAIAVTTCVESWTIVDPRMAIFQTANSAALEDLRNTTDSYFRAAMRLFPAPIPDDPTKLFPWDVPSEDDIAILERAAEAVTEAADTLMCYIHDFRVEMQKNLVGGLFPKGKVPVRTPLDPRHKVITLGDHKKLTLYFENETAWGLNNKRVRDDVLKGLSEI